MQAFVTGGNGFIGSHLVEKLLARGDSVVCLARVPQAMARLQAQGARIVQGDITGRTSLVEPIRGADVVYHLAGLYKFGPRFTPQMRAVNVEGTRNVLETAAELGVPRIIHTSTVGVFGNTHHQLVDETYVPNEADLNSEYERTKYEAHYQVALPLQKQGAPVIITQPGLVTGANDPSPHISQVELYLQRMPIGFGENAGATWAHVDDIADGTILASERGRIGESYILAGPNFTWRELMESWEPLTGIPASRRWASPGLTRLMRRTLSFTESLGIHLDFSAESLETVLDITFWARADKAKRELGWLPRSRDDVSRAVLAFEMQRRKLRVPATLAN